MEYRRLFIPGGTYFFTIVSYQRRPIFSAPEAVEILRDAFRYTLERLPFTIVASVILPDHMHFIWMLPAQTSDFSTRWKMIKSYFTKNWRPKGVMSESLSRRRKGEADVWQRRFWEHLLRDECDLKKHIEYIHYNPVKHGLVNSPAKWGYSSFMKYVRDGIYDVSWGEGFKDVGISGGREFGIIMEYTALSYGCSLGNAQFSRRLGRGWETKLF